MSSINWVFYFTLEVVHNVLIFFQLKTRRRNFFFKQEITHEISFYLRIFLSQFLPLFFFCSPFSLIFLLDSTSIFEIVHKRISNKREIFQ